MFVSVVELIGHLSFLISAISFYLRDMLLLRTVSVVAGIIGVIYNYFHPKGPLWLSIFWLSVFIAINVYRSVSLVLERRQVAFSDEERELHETMFRHFMPVEFMKLMRVAAWKDAAPGEVLATEGDRLDDLKLIYNGEVSIERDGHEVARARDGTMVGEMSFIQGGPATATVRTVRPTRYLSWPRAELRKLMSRNPTMDVAMKTVLSMDLTKKLGRA